MSKVGPEAEIQPNIQHLLPQLLIIEELPVYKDYTIANGHKDDVATQIYREISLFEVTER